MLTHAYGEACAGLRVVVETHGGHFWSTQGSVQRPLDITSLRIDQAERMSLQLADALISPTAYMTAFLKQRAWRLPKTSLVIPNVVPAAEADANAAPQARTLLRSELRPLQDIKEGCNSYPPQIWQTLFSKKNCHLVDLNITVYGSWRVCGPKQLIDRPSPSTCGAFRSQLGASQQCTMCVCAMHWNLVTASVSENEVCRKRAERHYTKIATQGHAFSVRAFPVLVCNRS